MIFCFKGLCFHLLMAHHNSNYSSSSVFSLWREIRNMSNYNKELGEIRISHYKTTFQSKNAAKRSRQHAGEKYWEYAHRCVCFVNVQLPLPHSNINVKFCTSRLCMKMSSFLFVRAWAMPRILYIACGVPFPV